VPALDRIRAQALLQRVSLAPDGGAGNSAADVLDSVRAQLAQTLLDERDLTTDQTLLGYLIVDTRQPLPSLDGSRFEVSLTRASDGAQLRQEQLFGAPPADPSAPSPP
jgi:hypothetical protein